MLFLRINNYFTLSILFQIYNSIKLDIYFYLQYISIYNRPKNLHFLSMNYFKLMISLFGSSFFSIAPSLDFLLILKFI